MMCIMADILPSPPYKSVIDYVKFLPGYVHSHCLFSINACQSLEDISYGIRLLSGYAMSRTPTLSQ